MGRLDHFVHLGVNMISISPIFKTTNEEPLYGQDIEDFLAINPTFGELQDLKDLTTAAKQKGKQYIASFNVLNEAQIVSFQDLKIILDLVLNHASKNHLWFRDSVANPTGDCGDCFVWREGKNGGPPNNWVIQTIETCHYLNITSHFPN